MRIRFLHIFLSSCRVYKNMSRPLVDNVLYIQNKWKIIELINAHIQNV
jgi:hypothetical protein